MRKLILFTLSAAIAGAGAGIAQTLPADFATSVMASAPQERNAATLAGGAFANLDTGFTGAGTRGFATLPTNADIGSGPGNQFFLDAQTHMQFSAQETGATPSDAVVSPAPNNSGLLGMETGFAAGTPNGAGNPAPR